MSDNQRNMRSARRLTRKEMEKHIKELKLYEKQVAYQKAKEAELEKVETPVEENIKGGKVKSTKKINKKFTAGLIAGVMLVSGAVAFSGCNDKNKDEEKTSKTEVAYDKETEMQKENGELFTDEKAMEDQILAYWDTLSDTTKKEFNNNPEYLVDFGRWINMFPIENFTEDYILEIYEMLNNANDNVVMAILNGQEVKGDVIKASKFLPETNCHLKAFTDREEFTLKEIKNPNDVETAKEWFKYDITDLVGLDTDMVRAVDLSSSESELAYTIGTYSYTNFNDMILMSNGIDGMTLPTPDGDEAYYPVIVGPGSNEDLYKIDEVSNNVEDEVPYFTMFDQLMINCSDLEYKEEDNQNSYGPLLEFQERNLTKKEEKKDEKDTAKLDMIIKAKNDAIKVKEIVNYQIALQDGTVIEDSFVRTRC